MVLTLPFQKTVASTTAEGRCKMRAWVFIVFVCFFCSKHQQQYHSLALSRVGIRTQNSHNCIEATKSHRYNSLDNIYIYNHWNVTCQSSETWGVNEYIILPPPWPRNSFFSATCKRHVAATWNVGPMGLSYARALWTCTSIYRKLVWHLVLTSIFHMFSIVSK